MKNIFLSIIATCTLSFTSAAQAGKELGNGGNAVALAFYDVLQSVLKDIEIESGKYPELACAPLESIAKNTRLLISEEPLYVEYNSIRQQSAAVNYKNPSRILIHRETWLALSENEKKAIAFHELLGLAGIESTGDYHISQRYFSQNKISLYDCTAWTLNANNSLSFTLRDSNSKNNLVYFDTPFTQRGDERFLITIGPGTLDTQALTSDSTFIQINRLRKKNSDWELSQATSFFGDPKLPRRFKLELDPLDSKSTYFDLFCSLKK